MVKKDNGKNENIPEKEQPEEEWVEEEWVEDEQAETEGNRSVLDTLRASQMGSMLEGLMGLSGQAAKMVTETATEQVLKMLKYTPEQLELMGRAGTTLKDAREVAGLSLDELTSAIDLKNPDLMKSIEQGKAGLPFDILLRLASFYARNDPIPFVMKYARTYNPGIWEVMKTFGLDKLTLEAEREIQFLNMYRSHDAARQLSDEGFERVREFTQRAFEMALHFVAEQENIEYEDEPEEVETKD